MPKTENILFGEEHQPSSLKEKLSGYLASWPLFIIFPLITVSAGIFYIRNTTPKYMAITTIMINGAEEKKATTNDLIESALNGQSEINLSNEILLLNSNSLMKRTVSKNNFNIQYLIKGRLLNVDINKDAPFTLSTYGNAVPQKTYSFLINKLDSSGGTFLFGPEKKEKTYSFLWNKPFDISGQGFILYPKIPIAVGKTEYIAIWNTVSETAGKISTYLNLSRPDAKASVIELTLKSENLQKGVDILNALIAEFNYSDIEERNKLSANTVEFIDERLLAISGQLKGVEGSLEDYQGNNQLVDIKSQSTQSLENSTGVSNSIKNLAIQQSVATMLLEYFNNPANDNKLIPSSMGLNDPNVSALITHYNEVQLKKQREEPFVTPNSTVMQDLNTQIQNLKGIILQSLNNISNNLKTQENGFQQQNNQYKSFLNSLPHNERALQEIKRKQTITEGLYLYLFQKREEAAISSTAANKSHYKQIDPASGFGPIEPNKTNIIAYSALLGLFLAFGLVYLRELSNDKISNTSDVLKKVSLPIVGEINHKRKVKSLEISVYDRSLISEQFRAARSYLSFQLKNKKNKCLLITSSASGEGKSFISLNIAAVFAIPGKKVALLEFDIRKPVTYKAFNLESNSIGLTDYLTGKIDDISKICYAIDEIPTLHFFPAGSLSINPADLLLSENLQALFKSLKDNYDYVIIDSPPVGLVSDSLTLSEYSDLVLFIVRQGKTLKSNLNYLKQLAANKSLNNISILLNDVKNRDTFGYKSYENAYENLIKSKKNKDS